MTETRTETDSFGPLEVQADRYWGAQTQRSLMNFPIGWEKQPVAIIRALGVIKQACATANKKAGVLDAEKADAIIQAAAEVVAEVPATPAAIEASSRCWTPVALMSSKARRSTPS